MKKDKVFFQIDRAKNQEFFVRIVMRNGKQTFTSGETYKRRGGAKNAINGLVDGLRDGGYEVVDLTR